MPQHPYEPAPDGAGTPEALPDPPTPPQPPSTLSRSAVPVAHPSVERRPPRNLEVKRPKTRATMRVDWEEAVDGCHRGRVAGDSSEVSARRGVVALGEIRHKEASERGTATSALATAQTKKHQESDEGGHS
ncbi:hypothetical protein TRAPUB_4089 [Trametes pubescens]|uniref:Uncharacterized protein n=1 Tax=Trametes pubescens TaxID=154538 RepID=A0A1M2VC17_TRAPU|nr:hypothetical protein TRAPUB_4089 [Trametes pubescens]